jgi:hypothetical protein
LHAWRGEAVTDDEWEQQRSRAILTALQTGRPVFADSDGVLRYIDGAREPVTDAAGSAKPISRTRDLALKAERASRLAFVLLTIAAIGNGVMALFWNTWQFAPASVLAACAVGWYRLNGHQRAALARAHTHVPHDTAQGANDDG